MIEIRHSLSRGNQKEAYDALYSNEGIHQADSFYRWILELLRPIPGKTLLDVSCGEGQLVYWAQRKGLLAHGIDISEEAIEKARSRAPEASLQVGNAEELPFSEGTFDYVTNIGSLEHYGNMQKGAVEIARVMKPDAKACILLPNIYGLLWQVRAVWRTGDLSDDGQPIQRYGTMNEWKRLLESSGLRIVRVHKYDCEFPKSAKDLLRFFRHPKRFLYLGLSPFIPMNLSSNFVYICEKQAH